MNLVSHFSQESWNNILWNHTFLLQSFCVYLVTCTYVISVWQPQLPPGVLQHCPHVTFPGGCKCVTDTIFALQRENENKEKKSRRNEVACQLPNWDSSCPVEERQRGDTSPLYLPKTQSFSEHRDEHHPDLPAMLLLVRVLRRHVWAAAPHPSR